MKMDIRRLGIALLALAILFAGQSAAAQVLYGTIVGNVVDPSGNVLVGATVTATETQTGITHQEKTSSSGEFTLRNVQPGVYTLKIDATGFAELTTTSISVGANLIVRADQRLALAGTKETVEVNASATEMQTDSGAIHGELSSKELSNLPIGGFNNYQSLLSLLPGATPSRFQNAVMDTPSRSLTTNINGASRNSNATLIDGAAIQQVYLPHHTLYNPPTEDIQSVDIVTNSFNAEQGIAGGAVVTVLSGYL